MIFTLTMLFILSVTIILPGVYLIVRLSLPEPWGALGALACTALAAYLCSLMFIVAIN